MQTPPRQPFATFGQYGDKEVLLDRKMRVKLGLPTGGGLFPCSYSRVNPEVEDVADDIPGLHEVLHTDRLTIDKPPWGDRTIYELTVTPQEYVFLDGTNVWGKSCREVYIGCIASVQFNYPNEPDPITCYTIIPFRPVHADETKLVARNDEVITIDWGGIILMNSEHAV